jgi:hypothetical protein
MVRSSSISCRKESDSSPTLLSASTMSMRLPCSVRMSHLWSTLNPVH